MLGGHPKYFVRPFRSRQVQHSRARLLAPLPRPKAEYIFDRHQDARRSEFLNDGDQLRRLCRRVHPLGMCEG